MTILEKKSKSVDKILHAAQQLFARQGYHGTSTRELARLADVAENTIFRHFGSKEDLFWAALRSSLSGLESRLDPLAAIAESADPEMILRQLFSQLLVDAVILRPELLRLIAIAIIELPWKASAFLYEHVSPVVSKVNECIVRSGECGKIRKVNSPLVTAAMFSTAVGYPAFATLIAGANISYSDDREAIRAYSKFWLELLAPIRSTPARIDAQSADSSRNRSK